MNDKFTIRLIVTVLVIFLVLSALIFSAIHWMPLGEFIIVWGSVGISSLLAIFISERMIGNK